MEESGICFSEVRSDITSSGRPYNYRLMELPLEGDYANVMEPLSNDKYMIGTEKGYVIIFSLLKNKALGIYRVDQWVSSLAYRHNYIWSVGADRNVCSYHVKSQKAFSRFQEVTATEKYPETGITFEKTNNPNFYLYNCGGMRFKVFNSRTRKPVKLFNVADSLKQDKAFKEFKEVDRVVRGYCVSRRSTKLFMIINRYHPHIVIYDYSKMQVLRFGAVFSKIDRQKQMAMNMRIFKTDTEDYLFFVNQLRDLKTKKVFTFGTALEHDPLADCYHLLQPKPISRTRR
jgi:hypothetical protein